MLPVPCQTIINEEFAKHQLIVYLLIGDNIDYCFYYYINILTIHNNMNRFFILILNKFAIRIHPSFIPPVYYIFVLILLSCFSRQNLFHYT